MVEDWYAQETHVKVRCVKEFRVKVLLVKEECVKVWCVKVECVCVCVKESCVKVLWVKEWCGTGGVTSVVSKHCVGKCVCQRIV